MTLTIATFLAGSLLSMLLPILLLTTLVFLIHRAVQRMPGGDTARRATKAEHASPAPGSGAGVNQPSGDPPVREV